MSELQGLGAELSEAERGGVVTDAGVSGRGFVSAGSATSDLVATLIPRNLRAAVLGADPLLTSDLWQRMREEAVPRRGGEGIVRTAMAAVDFALWDIKGTGPLMREEATDEGIVLLPPDAPGLGLELDEAVAAAALVPEA
jgi:L-alanine-DL-glutamate epimerase-like enolase superfamily enzyme